MNLAKRQAPCLSETLLRLAAALQVKNTLRANTDARRNAELQKLYAMALLLAMIGRFIAAGVGGIYGSHLRRLADP